MPEHDPRLCEMRFAQIEAEQMKNSLAIQEQLSAIRLEQKEQSKSISAIQQKVFNGLNDRIQMLSRMVWWLLGIAATLTAGITIAILSWLLNGGPT